MEVHVPHRIILLAWLGGPLALLMPGCNTSAETVECAPLDEDPFRVPATEDAFNHSVGILNGKVLVSWTRWRAVAPGEERIGHVARWVDLDARGVMGPELDFGDSFGVRVRWVAYEEALWAQMWAAFEAGTDLSDYSAFIRRVRVPFPSEGEPTSQQLQRALPEGCEDCARPSQGSRGAPEGLLAAAVGLDGPWIAHVAIPAECPSFDLGFSNFRRLHTVVGATDDTLEPVHFPVDFCDESAGSAALHPWLVDEPEGSPGLLFRLGLGPRSVVYYGQLTHDGREFVEPPRMVDEYEMYTTTDTGMQPRGVAVGDDRVLFSHRRRTDNECQRVRIMDGDGRNARSAPWQVPCISRSLEWASVGNGAVAVWGQRSAVDGLVVTSDVDFEEGVHAAFITSEGRLGSDVLRVSDAEATALAPVPRTEDSGPFVASFLVAAASEDDTVAVVWHDRRPDAPGVYVRRLRCQEREP
jgi:hypothetical protein